LSESDASRAKPEIGASYGLGLSVKPEFPKVSGHLAYGLRTRVGILAIRIAMAEWITTD